MLRDFSRHLQWSAEQVLDGQTWAEFYVLWCGGDGERRAGGHDPGRLRDQINRRRAERCLPPMKPATLKKR